jgi:hypothetical protein
VEDGGHINNYISVFGRMSEADAALHRRVMSRTEGLNEDDKR